MSDVSTSSPTSPTPAVHSLQHVWNAALVGELLKVLERHGIEPPLQVEEELYQAAKNFAQTSLGQQLEKTRLQL